MEVEYDDDKGEKGELARRMGTKQSGIARMINNPDSSTLDNLMKGLIALGTRSVGLRLVYRFDIIVSS